MRNWQKPNRKKIVVDANIVIAALFGSQKQKTQMNLLKRINKLINFNKVSPSEYFIKITIVLIKVNLTERIANTTEKPANRLAAVAAAMYLIGTPLVTAGITKKLEIIEEMIQRADTTIEIIELERTKTEYKVGLVTYAASAVAFVVYLGRDKRNDDE